MDDRPKRKRTRLRAYDYTRSAEYFVTMCTQDRAPLLGQVIEGELHLSAAGRMVNRAWKAIERMHPGVEVDDHVVLPDHTHGIAILLTGGHSLVDVVRSFKTYTTNQYITGVRTSGWPRFQGRLWQRSFHDRVLRNDRELDDARNYIRNNAYLFVTKPNPP